MLRNAGLTRRILLPLSAGLLVNTDRYFAALNAYRLGDVEPIVSTFVDAAFGSLQNADHLAKDLIVTRRTWDELISARSDSTVWPLLDYCLGHPAISASAAATELGVSQVAAQSAIDRLTEVGILRQNSPAKRNRLWLVSDVLDCVEQFMSRAHRR